MAERPTGFGFSKEMSDKMDAKYSGENEAKITNWMTQVMQEQPPAPGRKSFHEWLKDGTILCKLMNALQPGSCKPNDLTKGSKIPAMRKNKEMENISFFLNAAEKYGVGKLNLFQTVDLYEDQNMAMVQTTLFKLSGQSIKNGYTGPSIGVKEADKNQRDFDEQKLREGRNIIGLQMGTNQLASQGGMTPYGLGRQVAPGPK